MQISNEVKEVLVKSLVEGDKLYLPKVQLDRKLYVAVNKILEDLGGKWNRKEKAHLFQNNPSEMLDEIINTGEWTDKKKEYQFFETPEALAKEMVTLAGIKAGDVILEPSAGKGAIAKHITGLDSVFLTLVELNPDNSKFLRDEFDCVVINDDFMEMVQTEGYDKIIMNPPFSKQQDIKHVMKAWGMLNNGGAIVAIVSESPFFREDKLSKDFRSWLEVNYADVESLDSGTFKESGTMVKTRLIIVRKTDD